MASEKYPRSDILGEALLLMASAQNLLMRLLADSSGIPTEQDFLLLRRIAEECTFLNVLALQTEIALHKQLDNESEFPIAVL